MISESLIQSIVRNVLLRLEAESAANSVIPSRDIEPAKEPRKIRAGDLVSSPFEERIISGLEPGLPLDLGRPLVCIYEEHRPCDSCSRCEVRGF